MKVKQHRYQSCRDRDCERPWCRIWREAKAEFFQPRYDEGFKDGFAAGIRLAEAQ